MLDRCCAFFIDVRIYFYKYSENGRCIMENLNYYEPRRRERSDYRPESTGVKKEKTKTDYLLRLMVIQTVICTVLVGTAALVCKISPSAKQSLQAEYAKIMSVDMSVSEVLGKLKNAAGYAFEPLREGARQTSGAAAGDLPAQEDENEIYAVEQFEAVSDETGETVAVGTIEATGGGDMSEKTAKDGTSFAPYYVTVPPVMPVEGEITSRFGYRTNPITGKYGFHTGLDLACDEGTGIASSFYGVVKKTGENDVRGKYVIMEHSQGLETRYYHCSKIMVEPGTVIRRGEIIALVGSTGWSTGPHLHFEVLINNVCVNPELMLYPDAD